MLYTIIYKTCGSYINKNLQHKSKRENSRSKKEFLEIWRVGGQVCVKVHC